MKIKIKGPNPFQIRIFDNLLPKLSRILKIKDQDVELNPQVEVQDHIHSKVQNLEFGQVQIVVLKWNLVFQNNMTLRLTL